MGLPETISVCAATIPSSIAIKTRRSEKSLHCTRCEVIMLNVRNWLVLQQEHRIDVDIIDQQVASFLECHCNLHCQLKSVASAFFYRRFQLVFDFFFHRLHIFCSCEQVLNHSQIKWLVVFQYELDFLCKFAFVPIINHLWANMRWRNPKMEFNAALCLF